MRIASGRLDQEIVGKSLALNETFRLSAERAPMNSSFGQLLESRQIRERDDDARSG